ncbi:hypothetical protein SFRURICE_019183 [Spodoptera frugiperda]|nr:hypothetical protein SFRURICE_019183 [Spodoptera frugiperda]
MTCVSAIDPVNHFVGNGTTQHTAPPTVGHLCERDASTPVGWADFNRAYRSQRVTNYIIIFLFTQSTSALGEPTCPSRRHSFTSMTCVSAIDPVNHFVGNGTTQHTAPPTVGHLCERDASTPVGWADFNRAYRSQRVTNYIIIFLFTFSAYTLPPAI